MGRSVRKTFPGHGTFSGKVTHYFPRLMLFSVQYDDEDGEELTREGLDAILIDDEGGEDSAEGAGGDDEAGDGES